MTVVIIVCTSEVAKLIIISPNDYSLPQPLFCLSLNILTLQSDYCFISRFFAMGAFTDD